MDDRSRQLLLAAVVALVSAPLVTSAPSRTAAPADGRMRHVGQSYLFDYGDLVIRVRYLSDSRLQWEQIKGPQTGLKAEEQYGCAAVRDDVVFFWWQEKDSGVVTQVVDFGRAVVHTTWTSPDKKLAGFQGKVRPPE